MFTDLAEIVATTDAPQELQGRIQVKDLIDRLLDAPMDARIIMSMQESKSFPIDIEGYHILFLEQPNFAPRNPNSSIWRSSHSSREDSLPITALQREKSVAISAVDHRTVRELIHKLSALDPEQLIDLGGHFYTDFVIRAYPIPSPFRELKMRMDPGPNLPDLADHRELQKALEAIRSPRRSLFARLFGIY